MARTEPTEELTTILGKLTRPEREILRNYLTTFDIQAFNKANKSVQVAEYLWAHPSSTRKELREQFDLPADKYNFNKFIARLQDKVLECLTLSVNTQRKYAYSSWYANKVAVRQKLTQAQTLLGRGLQRQAVKIYEDVARSSEKFELYEEALEAYRYIQNQQTLTHGITHFYRYKEPIARCAKAMNAVWESRSFRLMHFAMVDKQSHRNEKIGFLTEAISQMQQYMAELGSSTINFYLHTLLMEFYLVFDDHIKVKRTGGQIIDILLDSPAVFHRQRLANVYMDMADNEIYAGNFDSAIDNLKLAIAEQPKGGYNHIVAEMLYCYCLYYKGELKRCEQRIKRTLRYEISKEMDNEREQLLFLRAHIAFLQDNVRKAYKQSEQDVFTLEDDSSGWNIGLRVFRILCCIEMGSDDLAYRKITSLERHANKLGKKQSLRNRDKNVVKILSKLARFEFDFNKARSSCKYLLEKLKIRNDEELRWQPRSHEQIIIDRWFEDKAAGRTYRFTYPEAPQANYSFITEQTAKTLKDAETILH